MLKGSRAANLERLTEELRIYAAANTLPFPDVASSAAQRISDKIPLSNSSTDESFRAICRSGELVSAARLVASGIRELRVDCAESILGTADNVFFYVAPFRYPATGCGLLFARHLEDRHAGSAVATPFDSGGLHKHCKVPDSKAFLAKHEMDVPDHRRYLTLSMDALFAFPGDYLKGTDPLHSGPICLPGADPRRWTHEVRISGSVPLRGSDLAAVFAKRSSLRDTHVKALFEWCARESVDRFIFNVPKTEDFDELRRLSLRYIESKLQ